MRAADIVFVSEGDADKGMQILYKKDFVNSLHELWESGKPLFGLSAGSIMLAKKWVRSRDPDDNSTAELFPCLGFAPVICDTHREDDSWEELITPLRLAEDGEIGFGIVAGTALKIDHCNEVEALKGAVHRFIKKEKRWYKQQIYLRHK